MGMYPLPSPPNNFTTVQKGGAVNVRVLTFIEITDEIAATYNFNDNAQMKLNQTIKNALDPKGILAPGKNGIWPKVSVFQ